MSQSAAEREARINALFDRALTKGKKRGPVRLTYQRLADELAAIADDFRGSDRDAISQVVNLLEARTKANDRRRSPAAAHPHRPG